MTMTGDPDLIPFVIRPRCAGKTTQAVAWVKEDPEHRAIATATADQARELRRLHGLSERQVVYAGQPGLRGRNVTVAVDNADLILARLLGAPIGLVTATGESA